MKQLMCVLSLVNCLSMSVSATAQDTAPVVGGAILDAKTDMRGIIANGHRATKLIRADVFNELNQEIGNVKELIIAPDGKLSVAIIPVGGFLGIGAKNVAIPTQPFEILGTGKVIMTGAIKVKLKEMPEFQYAI